MKKKFVSVLFVAAVLVLPFSATAQTMLEVFFDEENSTGNIFSTGTLDFSLESAEDFSGAVSDARSAKRNIEVKNDGSLGFQYQIKADNFSGSLCDELDFAVELSGGSELHSGNLNDFSCAVGLFSDPSVLEFEAELKSDASGREGGKCEFDLVFEGWQEDFSGFGDGGFWDTEVIANRIESEGSEDQDENIADHLVINEISADGYNNWIRLYNPTDQDIDLSDYRIVKAATSSNWYIVMRIGDSNDGSFPGGTIIKSKNYYLIARDDSSDAIRNIADAIGTRDYFTWTGSGYTLYLGKGAVTSDSDEDIVDKVGFGSATFYEGNNPAPQIPDGKSIWRIQPDLDTNDNEDDFIINDSPN